MDNIIIYSFPGESHKERVREVLERLRKASLYVTLLKYEFLIDKIDYLKYRVGRVDILIDPTKIRAI